MKESDKIYTNDEFKTLPKIKTETFDDYTEQFELDFPNYEEIELGQEFKTEPLKLVTKKKSSHYNVSNLEYKLMYCKKCDKTWKYASKKGHYCFSCKTALAYKCKKCMKLFKNRYSLTKHLNHICNNNDSRFICDHCQFKTKTKPDLANHIYARHLPRDPIKNKCRKCGKSYSWLSDLSRHMKLCGKTKDYKYSSALKNLYCHHCRYHTYRKDHLVKHIHNNHLPRDLVSNCKYIHAKNVKREDCSSRPRQYFCHDCGYNCVLKMSLLNHIQMQHLSGNFKCTACGKLFGSEYNLYHHTKFNCKDLVDLKRFYCDHCDYKASRKYELGSHIQSKHMRVSFKCRACEKSFVSHFKLYKHTKYTSCKKKIKISPN